MKKHAILIVQADKSRLRIAGLVPGHNKSRLADAAVGKGTPRTENFDIRSLTVILQHENGGRIVLKGI